VYLALNIKHNYAFQSLHSNCSVTFLDCRMGRMASSNHFLMYFAREEEREREREREKEKKRKTLFAVIYLKKLFFV